MTLELNTLLNDHKPNLAKALPPRCPHTCFKFTHDGKQYYCRFYMQKGPLTAEYARQFCNSHGFLDCEVYRQKLAAKIGGP
jgi:hypothetical protein